MARQCLRFFDNQMWFTEAQVCLLCVQPALQGLPDAVVACLLQILLILKALAAAPESTRRAMFEQVRALSAALSHRLTVASLRSWAAGAV
jgi:hypothetical protein